MGSARYLTAEEAAAELGIRLTTLYAYVSRGLIRSEAVGGSKRTRRYPAEDVGRLKARREQRRDPEKAVQGALHWGEAVLESAITLIADGRLHYRGQDALALAGTATIEEVAALIWAGDVTAAGALFAGDGPELPARCRQAWPGVQGLAPIERLQALLPLLAVEDPAAYDLRPEAVAATGARMLRWMVVLTPPPDPLPEAERANRTGVGRWAEVVELPSPLRGGAGGGICSPLVHTLQHGWGIEDTRAEELLNAALILCADHELNVSSFTSRCIASAGASPYAAVLGGLAALQGMRHGGSTERVEAFLTEVAADGDARAVIGRWLKRGERVPGFGHPLYPDGDPRGRALLAWTAQRFPESPATRLAATVAGAGREILGQEPNLDLGLVVVARVLGLPPGAALALFALGRTIGWIGHAIEQYATGQLIRPRARYVEVAPNAECPRCTEADL
jgi:citrate synthase